MINIETELPFSSYIHVINHVDTLKTLQFDQKCTNVFIKKYTSKIYITWLYPFYAIRKTMKCYSFFMGNTYIFLFKRKLIFTYVFKIKNTLPACYYTYWSSYVNIISNKSYQVVYNLIFILGLICLKYNSFIFWLIGMYNSFHEVVHVVNVVVCYNLKCLSYLKILNVQTIWRKLLSLGD